MPRWSDIRSGRDGRLPESPALLGSLYGVCTVVLVERSRTGLTGSMRAVPQSFEGMLRTVRLGKCLSRWWPRRQMRMRGPHTLWNIEPLKILAPCGVGVKGAEVLQSLQSKYTWKGPTAHIRYPPGFHFQHSHRSQLSSIVVTAVETKHIWRTWTDRICHGFILPQEISAASRSSRLGSGVTTRAVPPVSNRNFNLHNCSNFTSRIARLQLHVPSSPSCAPAAIPF